jgi:hypothetical protein
MPGHSSLHSLLDAVERYFDLMFDSDVSRFDQVFAQPWGSYAKSLLSRIGLSAPCRGYPC